MSAQGKSHRSSGHLPSRFMVDLDEPVRQALLLKVPTGSPQSGGASLRCWQLARTPQQLLILCCCEGSYNLVFDVSRSRGSVCDKQSGYPWVEGTTWSLALDSKLIQTWIVIVTGQLSMVMLLHKSRGAEVLSLGSWFSLSWRGCRSVLRSRLNSLRQSRRGFCQQCWCSSLGQCRDIRFLHRQYSQGVVWYTQMW